MASIKFKNLVSKKKKRFQKDGFDLDLSYITPNIIAMGYPAEKLEGVYRNNIDDVVRCCEREYAKEKFEGEVALYPFEDHNVPTFSQVIEFCDDVANYLKKDKDNVAVVHCKAGKGRTGLMICCYLLHCEQSATSIESLKFYGEKRTHDRKGVTIPSQQRYVHYYDHYLKQKKKYRPVCLLLTSVRFECVPSSNPAWSPCFTVSNEGRKVASPQFSHKNQSSEMELTLDEPIPISGDVKVEFINKRVVREKMFHCWFNTFFVVNPVSLTGSPCLSSDRQITGSRPSNLVTMRTNPAAHSRGSHQHREAVDMDTINLDYSSSGRQPSANTVRGDLKNSTSMRHLHQDQHNTHHLDNSSNSSQHLQRHQSEKVGTHKERFAPSATRGEDRGCRPPRLGEELYLTLPKWDLDKALKDTNNKVYPKDFKVMFTFELQEQPNNSMDDEQGCVKSVLRCGPTGSSYLNPEDLDQDRTSSEYSEENESDDSDTESQPAGLVQGQQNHLPSVHSNSTAYSSTRGNNNASDKSLHTTS